MTRWMRGRARAWCVAVAAVCGTASCGPVADDEPEIELEDWLFGIWSSDLMTSEQASSGSQDDAGVGEHNSHEPGHHEFSGGVWELSHEGTVEVGVIYSVRSWERVSNDELLVHPNEDDEPGSGFRLVLTTGERGCDMIEAIRVSAGGEESMPAEIYRGAICTEANAECPEPAPAADHNCYRYHYTWCDEQGANSESTDYGEDRFCNR